MNQLRIILLVAGVLLIVGLYVWGMRSRSRTGAGADAAKRKPAVFTGTADSFEEEPPATAEPPTADFIASRTEEAGARTIETAAHRRNEPVEPKRSDAFETRRIEPSMSLRDPIEPQHASSRREPTWTGADRDEDIPDEMGAFARPTESRSDSQSGSRTERPGGGAARIEPSFARAPAAEPAPQTVDEPAPQAATEKPKRRPQKIIAMRVNAVAPARLDGTRLKDAILAEDLAFGRYDIFHRLHTDGRPIFSVASLREPGTFDLEAMPATQYPGIALFVVLPGPVPAAEAIDEMVFTARALAAQLGGGLADERGVPLTPLRLGRLREEALEFERGAGEA